MKFAILSGLAIAGSTLASTFSYAGSFGNKIPLYETSDENCSLKNISQVVVIKIPTLDLLFNRNCDDCVRVKKVGTHANGQITYPDDDGGPGWAWKYSDRKPKLGPETSAADWPTPLDLNLNGIQTSPPSAILMKIVLGVDTQVFLTPYSQTKGSRSDPSIAVLTDDEDAADPAASCLQPIDTDKDDPRDRILSSHAAEAVNNFIGHTSFVGHTASSLLSPHLHVIKFQINPKTASHRFNIGIMNGNPDPTDPSSFIWPVYIDPRWPNGG